jgi:hypothetical protein
MAGMAGTASGDLAGVDSASSEDVVVAEGDFDELLKQAFLKPDVVEKTRKLSAKQVPAPDEEEPSPESEEGVEDSDVLVDEKLEDSGSIMDPGEAGEESRVDADHGHGAVPAKGGEPGEEAVEVVSASGGVHDQVVGGGKASIEVIRYLSKF